MCWLARARSTSEKMCCRTRSFFPENWSAAVLYLALSLFRSFSGPSSSVTPCSKAALSTRFFFLLFFFFCCFFSSSSSSSSPHSFYVMLRVHSTLELAPFQGYWESSSQVGGREEWGGREWEGGERRDWIGAVGEEAGLKQRVVPPSHPTRVAQLPRPRCSDKDPNAKVRHHLFFLPLFFLERDLIVFHSCCSHCCYLLFFWFLFFSSLSVVYRPL